MLLTLISKIYPNPTKDWVSSWHVSDQSDWGTCRNEGSSCFVSKIINEVTHITNINQSSDIAECVEVHQLENNTAVINDSSTKVCGCLTKKQKN